MSWLIFPGICVYFLIGWVFAEAFKTDLGEDIVVSIFWFLFWPIGFLVIAVFSVFFLVLSIILLVALIIDRTYKYFRPRRVNDDAS